jgi:tetratricopeptide (TPR) repeat protein
MNTKSGFDINNQRIMQLFQQATSAHQKQNFEQAKQFYKQILEICPKHADSLHLLGLILADEGDLETALHSITQAIQINPRFAAYYLNRGLLYQRMKQLDKAMADFRQSIYLDGEMLQAHCNLGSALLEKKKYEEAAHAFQRASRINPQYINPINNLGNVYLAVKNYKAAIDCYQRVLTLDPNCVETMSNLGVALVELNRVDEAIDYYKKALAVNPGYSGAAMNLGMAYHRVHDYAQAEAIYRGAIERDPNNAEFYSHLSLVYKDQGDIETALKYLSHALALDPDSAEIQFNEAITLLTAGDFINGWKKYECRFRLKEREHTEYDFKQPPWKGENFAGKTLFIHVEQGIGDVLQCIRYLPLVKALGGCVIMEVARELLDLLRSNDIKVDKIVLRGSPPSQFDYHISIMSLPMIFNAVPDNIPLANGYLRAKQDHLLMQRLLLDNSKFNVGIVWAGSNLHKNDFNRSIALREFLPLFANKKAHFYSLQFGERCKDIIDLNCSDCLTDTSPLIKDFSDTAAIINQLDLVITVDTSVAHLSGALGKPTWILLPFAPDFRWLLDRVDSPWYTSVSLFRQTDPGNWGMVMQKVASSLQDLIPNNLII